ncbi:MAG: DUF2924 domain-containing protein [Alphaproteobacteria bacterium]|nr:DUF2924 domain-containing protein [Alphaproteobacteria bacterium]
MGTAKRRQKRGKEGVMTDCTIARVAALPQMDYKELRALWDELFDAPPNNANRDFMARKLAWRIQEIRYGGLSADTKSRMTTTARRMTRTLQESRWRTSCAGCWKFWKRTRPIRRNMTALSKASPTQRTARPRISPAPCKPCAPSCMP